MAGLSITDPVELHVALTSPEIIPGDTIYLRGGNYLIGDLGVNLQGTAGAHITIKAYDSETPVIIPSSGTRCMTVTGKYLDFQGIVFDGTNIAEDNIKVTDGAEWITFQNVEIRNCPKSGILVSRTNGISLIDCYIHNNGDTESDYGHGIYMSVDVYNALVRGCELHDNGEYGIHFFAGPADAEYTIERNYIHDQFKALGVFHGTAHVHNNVVRGAAAGINANYDIVIANIFHNTFLNCIAGIGGSSPYIDTTINAFNNLLDTCSIDIGYQNPHDVTINLNLRNNLHSRNTGYLYNNDPAVDVFLSGEITDTVLPVTDSGEQFIPTTGSAALAAAYDAGITDDYAGNVRNVPATIGAWE